MRTVYSIIFSTMIMLSFMTANSNSVMDIINNTENLAFLQNSSNSNQEGQEFYYDCNFPPKETISIDDIKEIEFSKVTIKNCSAGYITNDLKKKLEELFRNSLNLTYLHLSKSNFVSNLSSLIINAITKSENLTYFYSNFFTEDLSQYETDSFYLGLMNKKKLKTFDFLIKRDYTNMNILTSAIDGMEALEELNLFFFDSDSRTEFPSIYLTISNKYNMKKLKIYDKYFSDETATVLSNIIINFTNIESLILQPLESNKLTEIGTALIINSLQGKSNLIYLGLENSVIDYSKLNQRTVMLENHLDKYSYTIYDKWSPVTVYKNIWSKEK